MKDIETRHDIECLLTHFYSQALQDEIIGFIFTDVAKINLKSHLPIVTDFWETLLLGTNSYRGNPMAKHQQLHGMMTLTAVHFDRWLLLFHNAVDELFEGRRATEAKARAQAIATSMYLQIVR